MDRRASLAAVVVVVLAGCAGGTASTNDEGPSGAVVDTSLSGSQGRLEEDIRFTAGSNVTIAVSGLEDGEQVTLQFDGPEPRSNEDTGDPQNFALDWGENYKTDNATTLTVPHDGIYQLVAILYANGGDGQVRVRLRTDGEAEVVQFIS